jgi:hypothetical protein
MKKRSRKARLNSGRDSKESVSRARVKEMKDPKQNLGYVSQPRSSWGTWYSM